MIGDHDYPMLLEVSRMGRKKVSEFCVLLTNVTIGIHGLPNGALFVTLATPPPRHFVSNGTWCSGSDPRFGFSGSQAREVHSGDSRYLRLAKSYLGFPKVLLELL
jgi:hypothetical protein